MKKGEKINKCPGGCVYEQRHGYEYQTKDNPCFKTHLKLFHTNNDNKNIYGCPFPSLQNPSEYCSYSSYKINPIDNHAMIHLNIKRYKNYDIHYLINDFYFT
jgi:hypothetical protein